MGCCGGVLVMLFAGVLFVGLCTYGLTVSDTAPPRSGAGPSEETLYTSFPGLRHYITGCENGVLELATVNLFQEPGLRVIGQLDATGPGDPCKGEVVVEIGRRTVGPRDWVNVQAVVDDDRGWVSELMIGEEFDVEDCELLFGGLPGMLARCKPPAR